MKEEFTKYVNYKWMMSAIFKGADYIIQKCQKDKEFEFVFFYEENLSYLVNILQGCFSYQVFDEDKLHSIAQAMAYYIDKYQNENQKTVLQCAEILELTSHPIGKSVDAFYKYQYSARNRKKCKKVTKELKEQIDKEMTYDIGCLNILMTADNFEDFVNDIQFLKCLNIIITECPAMLYLSNMLNDIRNVLNKNIEYKENAELQYLNNDLLTYIEELEKNSEQLRNQISKQTVFSLIFNPDLELSLESIKNHSPKEVFFNQEYFDILCDFIMQNKEVCMFDDKIIENVRTILFTFLDEAETINMKYSLNDLKVALNIFEDDEYRKKNKLFYKTIAKQYLPCKFKITNLEPFKEAINHLINQTNDFIVTILEQDEDIESSIEDEFTPFYINYILNTYPLIVQDPNHISRIEDILLKNIDYMNQNSEGNNELEKSSYQIIKKVKKLCK